MHWRPGVSFGEDARCNREDNGPTNTAVIRRSALGVVGLDQTKGSLSAKLKRPGWNDEFLPRSNAIALGGPGVLARTISIPGSAGESLTRGNRYS